MPVAELVYKKRKWGVFLNSISDVMIASNGRGKAVLCKVVPRADTYTRGP